MACGHWRAAALFLKGVIWWLKMLGHGTILCAVLKATQAVSVYVPSPGTVTVSVPLSHSLFFPTTLRRSPCGVFQSILCSKKKSQNRRFKGNTTLMGRMFSCYLKCNIYICSAWCYFKQEMLMWFLVIHRKLVSTRMTEYYSFPVTESGCIK